MNSNGKMRRRIFTVETPLGYRAFLTRDRWRQIVRTKHPALAGHEKDLRACLEAPTIVRESAKEAEVHLYYAASNGNHLCVVVAPANEDEHICCDSLLYREHQERKGTMAKLKVCYDREGNTLSVWFDDPKKEHLCEESDDDMILVKDKRGRVIGFERLNFLTAKQRKDGGDLPLEVQMI